MTNSINRDVLWNFYFESEFRARYYSLLSDNYKKQVLSLSVAIGLLSCGPLVNALWEFGFHWLLSASGVVAGLIGVYLAISGLPQKMSVATHAAKSWNEANGQYRKLWEQLNSGKNVAEKRVRDVDEYMVQVDNEVLDTLVEKQRILSIAEEQAVRYLTSQLQEPATT